MARKDYVKKTGGFIGGLVGGVVGLAAGGVHAAAKLIETGSTEEAGEAFENTSDAVFEGGVEVGEDLAPGIIFGLGGIIANEATKSKKKDRW